MPLVQHCETKRCGRVGRVWVRLTASGYGGTTHTYVKAMCHTCADASKGVVIEPVVVTTTG